MPSKPPFTSAQFRMLQQAAKKLRKRFKNQEEYALALGITQPSLSALLLGKWKPGITTATAIAHLEGVPLEELVGPYGTKETEMATNDGPTYPNLEACIRFYTGTRSWSAWTIAAARAGVCGEKDLSPPQWPDRLDAVEAALGKVRK